MPAKAVLLIVVLGFHTLSSCVNTRQALGLDAVKGQVVTSDGANAHKASKRGLLYNSSAVGVTLRAILGILVILAGPPIVPYNQERSLEHNTTDGVHMAPMPLRPDLFASGMPSISNQHSDTYRSRPKKPLDALQAIGNLRFDNPFELIMATSDTKIATPDAPPDPYEAFKLLCLYRVENGMESADSCHP
ncbi:hypothetical protein [Cardinium endosymbiont of Sogatella furcifera]|uniref:hypothetical protein n=1 Tax=Cardinium endosymbiont of Sogatella furcifera TaxID=650378 RepID=UPI0013B38C4C|nr:hypothetical protein [Cardinium endosymbiont of Sogatella furcifera]